MYVINTFSGQYAIPLYVIKQSFEKPFFCRFFECQVWSYRNVHFVRILSQQIISKSRRFLSSFSRSFRIKRCHDEKDDLDERVARCCYDKFNELSSCEKSHQMNGRISLHLFQLIQIIILIFHLLEQVQNV